MEQTEAEHERQQKEDWIKSGIEYAKTAQEMVAKLEGEVERLTQENARLLRLNAAVATENGRLREKLATALGGYTCHHTTNPIQARSHCKACRAEIARQVESST